MLGVYLGGGLVFSVEGFAGWVLVYVVVLVWWFYVNSVVLFNSLKFK